MSHHYQYLDMDMEGGAYKRSPVIHEKAVMAHGTAMQDAHHNKCWDGKYWCVKDICGIVCAVITWSLISYAEFVVVRVILVPNPSLPFAVINGVIFQMLAVLAVSSHLRQG